MFPNLCKATKPRSVNQSYRMSKLGMIFGSHVTATEPDSGIEVSAHWETLSLEPRNIPGARICTSEMMETFTNFEEK